MTRLRRDADNISNYIDEITEGVGARGSSLRDVDRLTIVHNGGNPPRFLLQELKWRSEWDSQSAGQLKSLGWILGDLGRISQFTVWLVIVEDDGSLTVNDGVSGERNYTPDEYRELFHQWWFPSLQAAA